MDKTTIDFGIDLGTTNSVIAQINGVKAEIIKNNEGFESTPSVVWIRNNRIYVGNRAKDQLLIDQNNTHAEFKREMGSDAVKDFPESGRQMTPVELSAEVLKSLKQNVSQRLGVELDSAVITVPAAFESPQIEATKKAAQLAGLDPCFLIMEPTAAAMAYGFQKNTDKSYWFVYDFGGGTFDAAIMQLSDGVIQLVAHGGDNFLGGTKIDWDIVNKILVPAVLKQQSLDNFTRDNREWAAAFAKLKSHAEQVKIRLSTSESTDIWIDPLVEDFAFEFELERKAVAEVSKPYIQQSLEISKRVLLEAQMQAGDIEKVILVGGPTLSPYFRDALSHPKTGLSIPLEVSVDPLTVVAQGAAIFASTKRYEPKITPPAAAGAYQIHFEYQPVGSDPEPIVGGKLTPPEGQNIDGFSLMISSIDKSWTSGKIIVPENGAFMATLFAVEQKKNIFKVEVFDSVGTRVEAQPDQISYTIGNVPTNPPIIHSIGIALASNEVIRVFQKGQPLPARHLETLKISKNISSGEELDYLKIPIIEGGNARADRNTPIGFMKVHGKDLKRDIPAGSEVEITISMDENRLIRTKAYIPFLDEEFENVFEDGITTHSPENLGKDLDLQKKRLHELGLQIEDGTLEGHIEQDSFNNISLQVDRIDSLVEASGADSDAALESHKRLLELKSSLDTIEDQVEWPVLVSDAENEVRWSVEIVEQFGTDKAKETQAILEQEIHQAISAEDKDKLRRKTGELRDLRFAILMSDPSFWQYMFEDLRDNEMSKIKNQQEAQHWVARGHEAIEKKDFEGLKRAVRSLLSLHPDDEYFTMKHGFGSTVMR